MLSYIGTPVIVHSASPFTNMVAGEWKAISVANGFPTDTKLDSIKPSPIPSGFTGHSSVLSAWTSGDYDKVGRRFIIAATGGHGDYAGNEAYSFSTATFTWSRLNNPSTAYSSLGTPACDSTCWTAKDPYADSTPASRHTYDGLAFIPTKNALWFFGGVIWSPAGESSIHAYWLNLSNNTYTQKSNYTQQSGAQAVWDPVTQKVIGRRNALYFTYDPETDTYTTISATDPGIGNGSAMVLDPVGRKLYRVGMWETKSGHKVATYNLATASTSQSETYIATSGDVEIEYQFNQGGGAGLAWDPISRLIVAFGFTADKTKGQIYTLNPNTGVWTKRTASTGTLPPAPPVQGMWKKFFYVPEYDVFIAITHTTEHVWVYKPHWRISIPQGEWVMLRMPTGPTNYAIAGAKHLSMEFNPNDRKFYTVGGDYNGNGDSYRQAVVSLDLKARLEGLNNASAGWAVERQDCDAGIQPKHPDFVAWSWDGTRNVFWMVPGQMVVSTTFNCAGETTSQSSDLNFKWGRVMTYNPATKQWADITNVTSMGNDQWPSVYDSVTDRIIRLGGYSTAAVQSLNLGTNTWTATIYNSVSFIDRGQVAYDGVGRGIYSIDPYGGKLWRYNIDLASWTDLGALPGGALGDCHKQPMLRFNTVDNVLMWVRRHQYVGDSDCGGATLTFAQGDFQVYNPSTGEWTQKSRTGDVAGTDIGRTTTLSYDPTLNMLVALPHSTTAGDGFYYMGVYRNGNVPTPKTPPANGSILAAPTNLGIRF